MQIESWASLASTPTPSPSSASLSPPNSSRKKQLATLHRANEHARSRRVARVPARSTHRRGGCRSFPPAYPDQRCALPRRSGRRAGLRRAPERAGQGAPRSFPPPRVRGRVARGPPRGRLQGRGGRARQAQAPLAGDPRRRGRGAQGGGRGGRTERVARSHRRRPRRARETARGRWALQRQRRHTLLPPAGSEVARPRRPRRSPRGGRGGAPTPRRGPNRR